MGSRTSQHVTRPGGVRVDDAERVVHGTDDRVDRPCRVGHRRIFARRGCDPPDPIVERRRERAQTFEERKPLPEVDRRRVEGDPSQHLFERGARLSAILGDRGRPAHRREVFQCEPCGIADAGEQLCIEDGALGDLEERHAQCQQVACEVSRVDRRNVRGPQGHERGRVVPVVEVTAEALHAGHGGERPGDALGELCHGLVAEVVRGDGREQLQTHVRGGCPMGDLTLWVLLEVVRREVVVFGRHERLEEPPRLPRGSPHHDHISRSDRGRGCRGGHARTPCGHRRVRPRQKEREVRPRGYGPVHERDGRRAHHRDRTRCAHAVCERRQGARTEAAFGLGGCLPFQHVAVTDRHPPQCAHRGVGHELRLVGQNGDVEERAGNVAADVG